MRRNIWKEPSPELQKRLSSPGCLEYKRCLDEHEDWWEEQCSQGKVLDDDEYAQSWEKIDGVHGSLSDDDRATLDEESDIDSLNDDVCRYIWNAARRAELSGTVWTLDAEQQYIDEMQQAQYVYPEYSELVGLPSEKDFVDCGKNQDVCEWRMEDERQADLLLMGVFEWKGLYIARAHCQTDNDPHGWLVCTDPEYVPKDVLGVKRVGDYVDQLAFIPFHGVRTQWLHDYLFNCDVDLGNREAREKNQYVTFRDGNPYNCLPDNLSLAQKRGRGRPMLCMSCGEETTREESMVVSEHSRKARYCLDCLRWMVDGG